MKESMNCKNCGYNLDENSKFCSECGAQVVTQRITMKGMLLDLHSAVGWDSKFFYTIRMLLTNPVPLFEKYLQGTRKKFANPFTFFAINVAISLLVFNVFSEQYLEFSREMIEDISSATLETTSGTSESIDKIESQRELSNTILQTILRHYNILSYISLPVYALIAFLVFGKKYNFGEHLVISSYIQGLLILTLSLFFMISLLFGFDLQSYVILASMGYYSFIYKKLCQLSIKRFIISILKFLLVAVLFMLFSILTGLVVGKFIP